jgi:hypothetical protein
MWNVLLHKKKELKTKYFYEVEFNKPGGMIMPILVEITYEDDTVDNFKIPAQIWRKVMIVPIYTETENKKFKLTQN